MQTNPPKKTWASLVGNAYIQSSNQPVKVETEDDKVIENMFIESLKQITIPEKIYSFNPCGLNNTDNKCFMNVILQSLLSTSPFVNLLLSFQNLKIPKKYQYTKLFVDFSIQYQKFGSHHQNSFSATDFISSLNEFYTTGPNLQEDAQEYMNFLLTKLDTELNTKCSNVQSSLPQDGDMWITKGKKKML